MVNRLVITSFIFLLFSCNSELAKLNRISKRTPFARQLGSVTKLFESGNSGEDACRRVVVDLHENVICVGYTKLGIKFPKISNQDAVVVKLDRAGRLLWVAQYGSTFDSDAIGVDVDKSGNIYVAGYTEYDSGNPINSGDGFFWKLTPDGKQIFMKKFSDFTGGSGTKARGIKVLSSGDVIISGETSTNWLEASAGGMDAFVARLSSTGELRWGFHLGDTSAPGATANEEAYALAVSPDEKYIYAGGNTFSSIDLANTGALYDIFIYRVDADDGGNHLLKHYGGSAAYEKEDELFSIAVSPNGDVHATGSTRGNFSQLKTAVTSESLYLRLDSNLNHIEAKQHAYGAVASVGIGIVINKAGDPIMCGSFNPATASSLLVFGAGVERLITQRQSHQCLGIALDSDENIYLSGLTNANFSEPKGNPVTNSLDILLIRLNPDGSGEI